MRQMSDVITAKEVALGHALLASEQARKKAERARDAAYERAAQVCDNLGKMHPAISIAAKAIRALKGQPNARCPTCDSPQPHLHPAMQYEGEVQICPNKWHEGQPNAAPQMPDNREDRDTSTAPSVTTSADAAPRPEEPTRYDWNDEIGGWVDAKDYDKLKSYAESLRAELADEKKLSEAISRDCNNTALERNELRADAERYKWLREHNQPDLKHKLVWYLPRAYDLNGEGLDAAIDAARKEKPHE